MMRKITLWLLFLFTCWQVNAQVSIVQNFDSGTALAATGWTETGGKTIAAAESCSGNSIRDNLYGTSTTGTLVSPNQVAASNGTDLTVSFDYKVENWNSTVAAAPGWGNFVVQYSTDNGTNWNTFFTVDDGNHVTANTCATFTNVIPAASIPNGSDFRLRFSMTWAAGDWDVYFDNISATQVATTPPSCTVLATPANGAVNVTSTVLSWTMASGIPTGYRLNVGTTTGATDILNNLDVGNVLSYDLGSLASGTTYYVTIIPYNANGDATGCTETSFSSCGALIAPWTYDVETAATTTNSSIADCWSSNPTGTTTAFRWDVDGNASTPTAGTGPSGAYSGVNYFYTEGTSGTTGAVAELVSPSVDVSGLSNPTIQFYYHMFGLTMGELHVDVYDGASWNNDLLVITGQQQTASTDSWTLAVVSLNSLIISGDVQVRFRGIRGAGVTSDISLDDISFAEAPACFDPINIAASNITSSSIDLLFSDASGGSQFDFYYVVQPAGTGAPGTFPSGTYEDGSNSVDGINYSIPVSSLSSITDYEIYVAADCNGNWVGPINFTTLCGVYSVPTLEDFTTYVPTCWEEADNGDLTAGPATFGTSSWIADGFANNGTTGSARIEIWQATLNDWILSPTYAIPATGYELKFNAAVTQWNTTGAPTNPWESDDVVEVLISTTGTTNWTVLYTYNDANVPSITGDINIIDLDAYAGQDVRFAFRALEGATNGSADVNFYFDDFEIRLTPSCPEPTLFSASNVLSNQVDLSWTSTGSAWNIEYGPAGFTPGTGTIVPAGTNPFTLGPLAAQTAYDVYVQNDCGGGDLSAWTGPVSFTTACAAYIAPFLESFETNTFPACWIQGGATAWEFGSNVSTPAGFADYGADNAPDNSVSGTGTFIGMDGSDNTNGEVSTLTTPLIDISGLTTPYLSYYVFSNNTNDAAQNELLVEFFDGASWTIVETIQANLGASWAMFGVDLTTFTITGDVQVRFTITGVANGGSTFYNDILIDDVSIDEAPACFNPNNIAASNVTSSSIDLLFSDASGGAQFDFYYVVQPAGTGAPGTFPSGVYEDGSNSVDGINYSIPVSSLNSNTDYEIYVAAGCNGIWVGPVNFTTACAVYTVPELEDFAVFLPSCWQEADGGDLTAGPSSFGTGGWVVDGFGNVGTTGAIKNNIYTTGANDWVLSPLYTIPTTGWELKFDAAATQFASTNTPSTAWESDDYVEVLVSTGTTNWTVLYTYNDTNVPSNTGSTNIIDLDAYAGQDVRFAFRAVEGATNGAADIDFSLDNFEIRLTPACVQPTVASSTIAPNCGSSEFNVDVDVTDLGDTTAAFITDGVTNWPVTVTGVISVGPFTSGSNVTLTLEHGTDSACDLPLGSFNYTCPPANDDLCNAIPLAISAPATGNDYTLVGATAETNEPVGSCFNGGINGSVWFSFVAPSTDVEVTTDFGGGTLTDDDTEIAVYDATGVNCSDLSTLPAETACNQDATAPVNTTYSSYLALSGLTPGTTYYIQVDMWGTATQGTFGIQVNDLLSANNFDVNEFVAYPNPVKDVLTLEYSSDITSVRVINMLGQEVLAKTINATSTQVDMSPLAAGTYLVNVTSGDVQKIIKIVKQ